VGLPDKSGVPGWALTSAGGLPDKSGVPGRVLMSAGGLPDKSGVPRRVLMSAGGLPDKSGVPHARWFMVSMRDKPFVIKPPHNLPHILSYEIPLL
jgi:hypothetical protein